jgi:hypothetical protein
MQQTVLFNLHCCTSDVHHYISSLSFGMTNDDILRKLIAKLTADTEAYRAEAQRLESSDRSRHETSISMLEASSLAMDKCIRDTETMR